MGFTGWSTNFTFLDDFIDDGEADGISGLAVSKVLRKITGYDPEKYNDRHKTDAQIMREMQSSSRDIQREEAQAIKIARLEDKLERKRGAYCFNSSDDDSD